jgi:ribosome recycling factor
LRNEADEMIGDVHKMMDSFKNELVDQLGKLEKLSEDRELNKKEEKIFGDLEKSIDKIDEFINKKIKKIIK